MDSLSLAPELPSEDGGGAESSKVKGFLVTSPHPGGRGSAPGVTLLV